MLTDMELGTRRHGTSSISALREAGLQDNCMSNKLIPTPNVEHVKTSDVQVFLDKIRPKWQKERLIERVKDLLEVDPSCACQKLFNASMHDLKGKVKTAGVDIAAEMARQYKLPLITSVKNIMNYSTMDLIVLSYHMGLLSLSEQRKILLCYKIRGDLEHKDDKHEAEVEDCIYIFSTCINIILSRHPIQLVRVTDFKELIEQATAVIPDAIVLEDYKHAPQQRQEEILKFLISHILNGSTTNVAQKNALACLSRLGPITRQTTLGTISEHLQSKVGRTMDIQMARIANALSVFPHLRQPVCESFFEKVLENMNKVGTNWSAYEYHGELLENFMSYGGLVNCPPKIRKDILKYLVLTYVGTPGGKTQYGNIRRVFYSDTAAPLIKEIIRAAATTIKADLNNLPADTEVTLALSKDPILLRFGALLDLVEDS